MSSENHHHPHHYFYHQNHISTFLPMLCSRPSIKDVSLPQWRDQPGSFSNDPLSPRIGCMGQVKRHNKIVGLLTTKSNTTNISISPSVKYSKLKKLFSGRNLSTSTTNVTAPTASSCDQESAEARGRKTSGQSLEKKIRWGCIEKFTASTDPPFKTSSSAYKCLMESDKTDAKFFFSFLFLSLESFSFLHQI